MSFIFILILVHFCSLASNKWNLLIDQLFMIKALAWLVTDEFNVFHPFFVINGLKEFVADRADINHDQ